MSRKLRFLPFMLAIGSLYAQGTSDLNTMRDYFKNRIANGPYIFLQSPRTGLGVGAVYAVQDKTTIFYSRPEDCFSNDILNTSRSSDTMQVANFNSTGKYSLDVGLKVANSGPITEAVQSEFQRKKASTVVVKIPNIRRQLLTVLDLKRAIRSGMDADCKAALTQGKPQRWLIIEALYTDKYSISFENSSGTNVSISAGIIRILFPSFKLDTTGDYTGTLEFSDQPYIIAVKALKVDDVTKFAAGDIELSAVDPEIYYRAMSVKSFD